MTDPTARCPGGRAFEDCRGCVGGCEYAAPRSLRQLAATEADPQLRRAGLALAAAQDLAAAGPAGPSRRARVRHRVAVAAASARASAVTAAVVLRLPVGRRGWPCGAHLAVVVVAAALLLLLGCGPTTATPTPEGDGGGKTSGGTDR